MTSRQAVELPAIPWINRMAGPSPSMRYPTSWPWIDTCLSSKAMIHPYPSDET